MIDMVAAEFIPWFVRLISQIKNAVRHDRYGSRGIHSVVCAIN